MNQFIQANKVNCKINRTVSDKNWGAIEIITANPLPKLHLQGKDIRPQRRKNLATDVTAERLRTNV